MSSRKIDNISKTMGRPVSWPTPTTEISRRLQSILPREGKVKLGENFFDGLSEKGVESILSGKTEPPPSALWRISHELKVDLDWLAWGKTQGDGEKHLPPAEANGEGALLPHISRMAVELMDILNNFHLRTLEGVVTAEQFESILLAATGGMLEAARECGVEPKKAIG